MEKIGKFIDKFPTKKIIVVGDIMLDEYIYGTVPRISPEAPVPVHKEEKRKYTLGGGGNTASNIASLGGDTIIFGFVGKDRESEVLKEILERNKINYFLDDNHLTTRKTRIIGERGQQVFRTDREGTSEKKFSEKIKAILLEKAEQSDIIVISDYAKGAITPDLMDLLKPYRKKTIIDPKPGDRNLDHLKFLYRGAFLITPNEKEAIDMSNHQDIYEAGKILREEFDSNILITRAEKGMTLFTEENIEEIPTVAKEVFDVTGAGDTVIATLSLALASDSSLEQAANIANYAAGIAVGKIGTHSVRLNELEHGILFQGEKILPLDKLKKITGYHKEEGKTIVFTNGCYDVLHPGHIKTLKEASEYGDILVVAINSDRSVREFKGNGRPINNESDRAYTVGNINGVNYVTVFDEDDPLNLLTILKPDILVKGGNPILERVQEEKTLVESYGGKLVTLPLMEGYSTTETIKKIKRQ